VKIAKENEELKLDLLPSRSPVPKRSKDWKNDPGPSVHSDHGYTAAECSVEMRVPPPATARWVEKSSEFFRFARAANERRYGSRGYFGLAPRAAEGASGML
jgi:hypothetical protein